MQHPPPPAVRFDRGERDPLRESFEQGCEIGGIPLLPHLHPHRVERARRGLGVAPRAAHGLRFCRGQPVEIELDRQAQRLDENALTHTR